MVICSGASGDGDQQLRTSVNIFGAWRVSVSAIDIFCNRLAAGIDVSGAGLKYETVFLCDNHEQALRNFVRFISFWL